jgi:hypothetical protein
MNSHEIDAQLDRLNDQGKSYTQAYEHLGLTPPSLESVSPAAIEARTAAHDYYAQEFHLTGNEPLSPEQQQANQIGLAACRAALDEARKQRGEQ